MTTILLIMRMHLSFKSCFSYKYINFLKYEGLYRLIHADAQSVFSTVYWCHVNSAYDVKDINCIGKTTPF